MWTQPTSNDHDIDKLESTQYKVTFQKIQLYWPIILEKNIFTDFLYNSCVKNLTPIVALSLAPADYDLNKFDKPSYLRMLPHNKLSFLGQMVFKKKIFKDFALYIPM